MKAWALVGFLALTGCGGGSTIDPIEGSWQFDIDADEAAGLTFNADGTYILQHIFIAAANGVQDQAEQGVYFTDGNLLTTTPRKSTCPGPAPVSTINYTATSSTLTIFDGVTIATFTRNTSSGPAPNVAITFGCFQPDGSFVPGPLARVTN